MDNIIQIIDLGQIAYRSAWKTQERYFNELIQRKKQNPNRTPKHYLIFCQHPPVITLGKNGNLNHLLYSPEKLKQQGIDFVHTNRGGDITYHGPGQMVVYPILDLNFIFTDIHKYLRYLEQAIIDTIAHYGLQGQRSNGETGVWLEMDKSPRKICAIGIRVSRWVTMHGLALNINTHLEHFNRIVPCGIQNKAVTSIQAETQQEIDMQEVKSLFLHHFLQQFDLRLGVKN